MRVIFSSAEVALLCLVSYCLGFGDSLGHIIIGAASPLTPGVPLMNAVHSLLENDYLPGLVRMVDALLIVGCIAVGTGITLSLSHLLLGGSV